MIKSRSVETRRKHLDVPIYNSDIVVRDDSSSRVIEYGIFGEGLKFQPIRSENTVLSRF